MPGVSRPASPDSSVRRALRNQFDCSVSLNQPLCREHFRLVLHLSRFPPTQPGQFIQISCRAPDDDHAPERNVAIDWSLDKPPRLSAHELSGPLAFLRRPFSLAGRRDTPAGVELDIIHRVVGVGTDWLSRLRGGDTVGILGPLGNCFTAPADGALALLVGGGVGIPPMLYLAEALAGRSAVAFCGAVSKDLLPLTLLDDPVRTADPGAPAMTVQEFARHGIPSVVSTDDGTFGFRGFVTQALEQYLEGCGHGPRRGSSPAARRPVIYTCGPEPMMRRVADIAAIRGLECQVAVERAMACGMGTCQSCCIRVRKPDPSRPPLVGRDWCYRLACTDGPVFRGADLLW
jgi:dihydroorotate dehydrogenase electron transfer subunit